MCLCAGNGRKLWQLHNDFFAHFLKKFAIGDVRTQLGSGYLVVLFSGEAVGEDCEAREVLYHIGLHSFSPYLPTWFLLSRSHAPSGEPASSEHRIYVKAFLDQ